MDLQVHNINIYIYMSASKNTPIQNKWKDTSLTVEKNQDTNVTVP